MDERQASGRRTSGGKPRSAGAGAAFDRTVQRQAKVDAIVAAAARLIQAHGVAGTSLDDVAEALGVTKPSIYHYVKSKEELLYRCDMRIAAQQAQAVDAALAAPGSSAERLRTFVRHYAAFVWGPDSGLPRLWQDMSLSPARRKAVNQAYAAQSSRIVALIRDGVADGSLRPHDPEIVERSLVSAVLWVPIWHAAHGSRYDPDALVEQLLAMFFEGLSPPP